MSRFSTKGAPRPKTYLYRDEILVVYNIERVLDAGAWHMGDKCKPAIVVHAKNETTGECYKAMCDTDDKDCYVRIAAQLYMAAVSREEVQGGQVRVEELANAIVVKLAEMEVGL